MFLHKHFPWFLVLAFNFSFKGSLYIVEKHFFSFPQFLSTSNFYLGFLFVFVTFILLLYITYRLFSPPFIPPSAPLHPFSQINSSSVSPFKKMQASKEPDIPHQVLLQPVIPMAFLLSMWCSQFSACDWGKALGFLFSLTTNSHNRFDYP